MITNGTYPIAGLVAGLEEQRLDLRLSRRALARLAGVAPATVYEVERGRNYSWQTVIRLRAALALVELYGTPPPRASYAVNGRGETVPVPHRLTPAMPARLPVPAMPQLGGAA